LSSRAARKYTADRQGPNKRTKFRRELTSHHASLSHHLLNVYRNRQHPPQPQLHSSCGSSSSSVLCPPFARPAPTPHSRQASKSSGISKTQRAKKPQAASASASTASGAGNPPTRHPALRPPPTGVTPKSPPPGPARAATTCGPTPKPPI